MDTNEQYHINKDENGNVVLNKVEESTETIEEPKEKGSNIIVDSYVNIGGLTPDINTGQILGNVISNSSVAQQANQKLAELTGKANEVSQLATGAVNQGLNKVTDSLNQSLSVLQKIPRIEPEINIAEIINITLPDFKNHCNAIKIDFGNEFISGGVAIGGREVNILSNSLAIVNGVQTYLDPKTIQMASSLLIAVISDLITTTIGYTTDKITKYLSPDFVIELATQAAEKSLDIVKENTEPIDVILKKIETNSQEQIEETSEKEKEKSQKKMSEDTQKKIADIKEKLNKTMNDIEKYTEIVAKYMSISPEEAEFQAKKIVAKYKKMGLDYADKEIEDIEIIVRNWVDEQAEIIGYQLADIANDLQKRVLYVTLSKVAVTKTQLEINASALINKAVMQLMGLIGG